VILRATVGRETAGMRLDDGARLLFPHLSKTRLRKIIDWGGCVVAGSMVRVASRILKEGDELIVGVMESERCVERELRPDEILYEDSEYLAVGKEAGLNSQRTPYQLKGTLEYMVGQVFRSRGNSEPVRVVHRLDRGTSGVMIFPTAQRPAAHISALLKEGAVGKIYWAVVRGLPLENVWEIDAPIAKTGSARYGVATPGREARSGFRLLAAGNGAALVEAIPRTGRTHQLRVHLASCGLPIIGDSTYGGGPASRMLLHCRSMSFRAGDGREVRAVAPVDAPFMATCRQYGLECPNDEEEGVARQ
jgi:23S rRNA pseudouridine1911/1915/1917 synthase